MIKKQVTVVVQTSLTMEIDIDESDLDGTIEEKVEEIVYHTIENMDYHFSLDDIITETCIIGQGEPVIHDITEKGE